MNSVTIIPFDACYSKDFYELNVEWLQAYFYVEPNDEEVLSQPKKYIVDKGGYIFFAKLEDTIVGTVALMPLENNVFELGKMAVSPKYRGRNIGQQLVQFCLDFSRKKQLKKIILYSNRKLKNALYIYEKYGFQEIPIEQNNPYARGDIKMELVL
ncbi:acetyltransferase (GNAT) family protein [Kordia periserrulae]|uniref:Acetyltransferase (GNAT) family protein n=1 Tax=Kordia periserrulae TaxID=701523 RepID=A0A2T6C3E0_9FLAO|nr:GNAT family N-acetyltransferase [Kordia periserrulae]PTX62842.1 acetyltransferase (GNAT) family protein [Kordia periserrulae]